MIEQMVVTASDGRDGDVSDGGAGGWLMENLWDDSHEFIIDNNEKTA